MVDFLKDFYCYLDDGTVRLWFKNSEDPDYIVEKNGYFFEGIPDDDGYVNIGEEIL